MIAPAQTKETETLRDECRRIAVGACLTASILRPMLDAVGARNNTACDGGQLVALSKALEPHKPGARIRFLAQIETDISLMIHRVETGCIGPTSTALLDSLKNAQTFARSTRLHNT